MPTLSIREIVAKGDGNQAHVDVVETSYAKPISFYQYESLTFTVEVRRDGAAIQLPADCTVKLRAWVDGTIGTLYIDKAGTVTSDGKASFTLTDDETGFAAGEYKFDVRATQGSDTGGVIASGDLTVLAASAPSGASFLGPSSPMLTVANVVAGTNVTIVESPTGTITISAAGATLADGDYGDITVSSSGSAMTIDNGAVTLAKMANLANAHLIGRHAGSTGTPQAVAIDGGLELSGANLRRSALTGDVTASAGSNATTIANSAVTTAKIATSAVTNAKLANMADATVKGSEAGSGGGPPTDLSASDLVQILATAEEWTLPSTTISAAALLATTISGSGSAITDLSAGNITGDIPAASFGSLTVEAHARDLILTTSAEVGWTGYEVDNATRTFSADAVTSANTSAQTFVLRTLPLKVPRGFVAFKETGAIVLEWIADDTAVADITGIELIGYSDMTGSKNVLYTDTTTRNVATINVPEVVSINRSAFSSTTVPTHFVLEITGTIEDGKKLAILHAEIVSE